MSDDSDGEDLYDGIPYAELPIDSISWDDMAILHITTRSLRLDPRELDIEPEWATEAALDPMRLVGSGTSRDLKSIQVVGLSESAPPQRRGEAGRLLKVWLVSPDHPPSGWWWGKSACTANRSDRLQYLGEES